MNKLLKVLCQRLPGRLVQGTRQEQAPTSMVTPSGVPSRPMSERTRAVMPTEVAVSAAPMKPLQLPPIRRYTSGALYHPGL